VNGFGWLIDCEALAPPLISLLETLGSEYIRENFTMAVHEPPAIWKLSSVGLFDSIKGFASEPRHGAIASTLTFSQLEIESLKKRRRLKERARINGSEGLPAPSDNELDSVELEIAALIEQERDRALKIYADRRRSYDDRSRSLNLVSRITELEQIATTAKSQIVTRVHIGLDWLEQRQEYLRAVRNEYVAFRKSNNLQRPSRHPRRHAWHVAILISLLLIETALNGKFMAVGEELGYLGGIFQAFGIALVNIVVGSLVGFFFVRQLSHRWFLRSGFGTLSLLAYLIWSGFFNLAVAHYRDALAGPEPELAARLAKETLRSAPLDLLDFNSWLLFVMGLVFSMISLADGYAWDDPYPGYGGVSRRHSKAQDEYAGEKESLIDEVESIRDETADQLKEKGRAILAGLDGWRQIQDQRNALSRAFEAHQDQLQAVASALMQFYRQENTRARPSGLLAPAHFDQKWLMNRIPIDDNAEISLQIPSHVVAEKLDRIPTLTKEVVDTADGEVARYRRIAEQYGIADGEA
jgi:hypothetical protein